ncbi:hypothetical protein PG997_015038 [Apiospora hydei]|uniref:F-box domain-containing protein n=1 Tax=Apiospora hydei TaxID=1337664 RepID=A0ABR1UVH7_9PEZI
MQNLPLEVVDSIVHFLHAEPVGDVDWPLRPSPLAPYASISTPFLEAVQRRTWRSLKVNSQEDLDRCARYLLCGRRLSYLRQLSFSISLPAIDKAKAQRFERPAETKAVSQVFGLQLRRLFRMLQGSEANVQLALPNVTHKFADVGHIRPIGQINEIECGLGWCRHLRSRITLLQADELPTVHSVRQLSFGIWQRSPDPRVQLEIAARMPDLVELNLAVDGTELRYPGVLRKDRKSLADALAKYSEQTMQISRAALAIPMEDVIIDTTMAMPNLTYPLAYDVLGTSLRVWSQRLTSFRVHGVFDGALFWPQAHEDAAVNRPEWRNMQNFDVHLELSTPSGLWYFMPKGDPSYGRPPRNPAEDPEDMPPMFIDDEDDGSADPFDQEAELKYSSAGGVNDDVRTRNAPQEGTMEPLFSAWARALACMPSLRSASLRFRVEIPICDEMDDEEYVSIDDWEVFYEAPHEHNQGAPWYADMDAAERASRRLVFHNTGGWRPREDTMDRLQETGSESWPGTSMVVLDVNEMCKIVR